MESVSFIIPHKGREGMLIETIRSISALDYPHEQLEIVLVSQNPSVSADIRRAAGTINLQVIESSPNNTISREILELNGRKAATLPFWMPT